MTLIEHEFVRDALPVSLLGLNESSHCQYVSFCADYLLTRLGCPKIYNVQNPYDWMNMISMQSKVNFFEGRVDSYSLSKGYSGDEGKFDNKVFTGTKLHKELKEDRAWLARQGGVATKEAIDLMNWENARYEAVSAVCGGCVMASISCMVCKGCLEWNKRQTEWEATSKDLYRGSP